jgi:hypothetical protein
VATDRRTGSEPQPAAPKLAQRRGEILRGLFPKLTSWLETTAERARRRDVEDYLSQAADVCDLEERIRRLERRAGQSAFH